VLDLTGISVPAGTYSPDESSNPATDKGRLPFGLMLLGGSRTDAEVLEIAARFEEAVKKR
jgi:Asp-tRNA(Asn)/Glu-tRNA(Gln) amidotransferase A subunit family amidase